MDTRPSRVEIGPVGLGALRHTGTAACLPSVPEAVWRRYQMADADLRLAPSNQALAAYKAAVGQLVEHAVAGAEDKPPGYVDERDRFRRLVYLQALEQSLEELTADQLKKGAPVRLIQRLNLIASLLMDLFRNRGGRP